jgi:hypothetical protein
MAADGENINQLFYKSSTLGWVPVKNTFDGGKQVVISPHYNYPNFTTTGTGHLSAITGSVWVKTTNPNYGANWDLKYYNGLTQSWTALSPNIYASTEAAIVALDPVGGGLNIPTGTVIIDSDYNNGAATTATSVNFKLWVRNSSAPTTISASSAI